MPVNSLRRWVRLLRMVVAFGGRVGVVVTAEPDAASGVDTSFSSADGLRLSGTLLPTAGSASSVTVLVHGGGATRDESGSFTRLAVGLASAGVASLRFDLRGHGRSEA